MLAFFFLKFKVFYFLILIFFNNSYFHITEKKIGVVFILIILSLFSITSISIVNVLIKIV